MSTPPKWRDSPDVDSLLWFPHANGWSRDTGCASHQSATATSKRISAGVMVHKVPFHDPTSLAFLLRIRQSGGGQMATGYGLAMGIRNPLKSPRCRRSLGVV
jgi:hypothetical protein